MSDAHLVGKTVQRVPLNDFASCACKETLAFPFEVAVDDVAHNGVENGVAEKLQTLVVHGFPLFVASGHALVHQSELVIVYAVWIEAEDVVESRTKLLVLAEHEPHPVYKVINHHTS